MKDNKEKIQNRTVYILVINNILEVCN